jgi:hypothetical protein
MGILPLLTPHKKKRLLWDGHLARPNTPQKKIVVGWAGKPVLTIFVILSVGSKPNSKLKSLITIFGVASIDGVKK